MNRSEMKLMCTHVGCTSEGEITSFDFVLCDRHRKELANDLDNDYKKKVMEQQDIDAAIYQISNYEMELQYDLHITPWLFFWIRWELKARIRSVQSILTVIKRISNTNNPLE